MAYHLLGKVVRHLIKKEKNRPSGVSGATTIPPAGWEGGEHRSEKKGGKAELFRLAKEEKTVRPFLTRRGGKESHFAQNNHGCSPD